MKDFFLPFSISKFLDIQLKHDSKIGFIGSCFSDEMSKLASLHGFSNFSNPFGTIYHPIAIANILTNAISKPLIHKPYIDSNGTYFSLLASSKIYGSSEANLFAQIQKISKELKDEICKMDVLYITFGTAWGYIDKEQEILVANCHKMPNAHFEKKISSIDQVYKTWESLINKIQDLNPSLKIVFTVSPVRHSKDGVVENNRSKARLIEVVHSLCNNNIFYFPSYELMIDHLRDYRFYKIDRVHPNQEAIEIVWEKFMNVFMSSETKDLAIEIKKIKTSLNHKAFHRDSITYKTHLKKTIQKKEDLSKKHLTINWK